MKMRLAGATALLWLTFDAAAAGAALLIENVTLLSPELAQPLGNRYVLVRDGRIAAVSDQPVPLRGRAPDGRHRQIPDARIMDGHVHVSQAVGLPFGSNDPAIGTMEKEFFAQQPRSYLYFGVTQLLDPINMPERVAEFAAQPQHPDIYRCGVAPVVDGYPLVFIPEGCATRCS